MVGSIVCRLQGLRSGQCSLAWQIAFARQIEVLGREPSFQDRKGRG